MKDLPSALLLDLDGTLYTDAGAIPGAVDLVAMLRRRGTRFRFVSNTTGRSRARLAERLRKLGFTVEPEELITSVVAAAGILRRLGVRRILPLVRTAAFDDLSDFVLSGGMAGPGTGKPDAILVGDLGEEWSHRLLNEAFRHLLDGVPLVALEKDRYWLGPTGLELDTGPYVTALEYAAGVKATVCGKPTKAFYDTALETLGLSAGRADQAVMIGDDIWSDVDGAQRAGLQGWLVRTGKFRADVLERSGVKPDRILDSVADLCGETA